jgi:hypothetical protein
MATLEASVIECLWNARSRNMQWSLTLDQHSQSLILKVASGYSTGGWLWEDVSCLSKARLLVQILGYFFKGREPMRTVKLSSSNDSQHPMERVFWDSFTSSTFLSSLSPRCGASVAGAGVFCFSYYACSPRSLTLQASSLSLVERH